jgi:ABC-2 type transport system permease protein
MMGFYPAAFLLRGDEYRFYGLLAPLMGFIFLGLALSVWQVALRHY